MREFTVVIQKDEEGYYVAEVPGLKGCHTQARSLDELMERVKEAIELWLEVYGEEAFEGLELVGVQKNCCITKLPSLTGKDIISI
jgi:predicted RNase H-like HicB family nuclease